MTRKPKEPTSLQRARKAHADRLKAQGYKPKTFWLSPEALAALERLKGEPNFALNGKPNEGAAINAVLIEAAGRLNAPPAPPTWAERLGPDLLTPKSPPQGLKGDDATPQKPKTPDKTVKAVREAPVQTVGPKLDVQYGPSEFKPRLKDKGKSK
jgi:hypothetical protein